MAALYFPQGKSLELNRANCQLVPDCFTVKLGYKVDLTDGDSVFEKILNFAVHG